jgi:branched-chain amino acid transport system substrate-binding protein
MHIGRRQFLKATVGGTAVLAGLRGKAWGQAKPVRIGYTLSATGPYAIGAGIIQVPAYALWAEQNNARGGLLVKGEGRRPIEYVSIDDRSEIETAVRFYEKLMTEDKVDLILPPWGTAMHFGVAPVANRYGYPLIGPTVTSNKLKDLSLPYFYVVIQQPDAITKAIADLLAELKRQGKVSKIGLTYVTDLFGLELFTGLSGFLKDAGLPVVVTKSYPLGVKDLAPMLKEFKAAGVDALVGCTYPPDNILMTTQAKEVEYNPPVYFTAVGTAFPIFRNRFKGAEGVMGTAGWNPKVKTPGAREYFDAHLKSQKKEPDRWGSAFARASLEILEKCVAEVGLDRKRIKEMLDTHEFSTLVGPVRFVKGMNVITPGMVGQWQKGEFEIIWPRDRATGSPVVPKPAWA